MVEKKVVNSVVLMAYRWVSRLVEKKVVNLVVRLVVLMAYY